VLKELARDCSSHPPLHGVQIERSGGRGWQKRWLRRWWRRWKLAKGITLDRVAPGELTATEGDARKVHSRMG
jgi:hypothetical protein